MGPISLRTTLPYACANSNTPRRGIGAVMTMLRLRCVAQLSSDGGVLEGGQRSRTRVSVRSIRLKRSGSARYEVLPVRAGTQTFVERGE